MVTLSLTVVSHSDSTDSKQGMLTYLFFIYVNHVMYDVIHVTPWSMRICEKHGVVKSDVNS